MNVLMDYDYGPDFRYNDQSGVMTNVVPPIKRIIPTLAGKVDQDGNEIAKREVRAAAGAAARQRRQPGRRLHPVRANPGRAAGERRSAQVGGRALRQEGYNCLVRHYAQREVQKRYLLQENADRLIAQAAASNVLPSNPNNPIALGICKQVGQ